MILYIYIYSGASKLSRALLRDLGLLNAAALSRVRVSYQIYNTKCT